ncbi:MAG: hypothetical protein D6704_06210 [Nitrospirae bacterium]|nr:MAG: hypothetical protein D6704_06210 [Nitrospirota bacterium]
MLVWPELWGLIANTWHPRKTTRSGDAETRQGWRRLPRGLCCLLVLVAVGGHMGEAALAAQSEAVSIPLSNLDVEQATATVSVLDEARPSLKPLTTWCDPDKVQMEGEQARSLIKALCDALRRTVAEDRPPFHRMTPRLYRVTVPLREPLDHIQAVTWNAPSLEEAITFVELLEKGKLKGVRVYTTIPWLESHKQPCRECPIKELIFYAGRIKDQRAILAPRGRQLESVE